ncbi:MAG TPA: aldo/keto reductase [Chthoniobacterales bacterium]|nr:aldo/keto reductase [Chthoniobacterales bacterium]
MTRREAARVVGGTAAGLLLPIASTRSQSVETLMRAIPTSGERLPVIGLGTWQVFDVDITPENEKQLSDVLSSFVALGGRVVDSSPMYGRSEQVIGTLAAKLGIRDKLFFATKVWTRGKEQGAESMARSMARFQVERIDLMQVHNLVDLDTQLATIREWKAQGRFRYIGITHSNMSAHAEVERVLRREQLDFLQINYSIMEREAEQRILPLTQDRQVAVVVNRPFGGGDLFSRVSTKPLPEWAAEIDCRSWAQIFLKWIIAHPAVNCAIPATNKAQHIADNLAAGSGRLPDDKARQRIVEFVSAI